MVGPQKKGYLEQITQKLNGVKHLILGNHDRLKPFDYIDLGFTSVHTSLLYEEFVLNHDPAASVVMKDKTWLVGHVHDLFVQVRNVLNVGVDVRDFKPISIDEVRKCVKRWKQVDSQIAQESMGKEEQI